MCVQNNEIRDALEKLRVFQQVLVCESIKGLKPRVAEYPGSLRQDFVGEDQPVPVEYFYQEMSSLRRASVVRPNEHSCRGLSSSKGL